MPWEESDKLTDKRLGQLERKLHKLYKDAADEMDGTIKEYFKKFEKRDEEMKSSLDNGEITKEQYTQWRLAQIGRGQRLEDLRDKLAERMTKANEVAVAYVNDVTPGVYSLNMNYAAYSIEQQYGDIGFTIWSDETIRRLAIEEPDLMPYYPETRALNRGIDLAYGKQQITAQITSSILLGHSIPQMATALRQRIQGMNNTSAVRTARTAITAAQNGGRQATLERAAALGIKLRKRWVATKDLRTRPEHGHADGQTVPVDEPFDVGGEKLMFPGDRSNASGWNIYNCRCAMRSVEKEGIEAEPRMMRVRHPITGRNVLVNEMTYNEWLEWKESLEKPINSAIMASAGNNTPRNKNLESAIRRSITSKRPIFADGALARNAKDIVPIDGFYDAVLHGQPHKAFLFDEAITPQILANVLNAREDFAGQNIRLISCSTGMADENGQCFAQELANILGVTVLAPNNVLWVFPGGRMTIGNRARDNDGEFAAFTRKE